ncbi:hypothetical protein HAX54_052408, partial [Datura stramonium]|nr:hypothetical protein [Datura stramonium]
MVTGNSSASRRSRSAKRRWNAGSRHWQEPFRPNQRSIWNFVGSNQLVLAFHRCIIGAPFVFPGFCLSLTTAAVRISGSM